MEINLEYLLTIDSTAKILTNRNFNTLGLTATEYSFQDKALTFLSNEKYLNELIGNPGIYSVICSEELAKKIDYNNYGICIHSKPKELFYRLHNHLVTDTTFYGEPRPNKIDPSAKIHPAAVIAERDVVIGKNVVIEAQTVIHEKTILSEGVVIRAGSIIGGAGFQAVKTDTEIIMILPGGWVQLDKNVEIANNTCVDRAIFSGKTHLMENTKVDNLVHIAHDAVIGKNCLIVALSLIAGRCIIGDNAWVGAAAVISNGLTIGENAKVSLGAVVTKDVPEGLTVTGNFAIEHSRFIQHMKNIR